MNRRKFLASIAASAAVPMVSAEKKAEKKVVVSESPAVSGLGLAQRGDSLMQMNSYEYLKWRADNRL